VDNLVVSAPVETTTTLPPTPIHMDLATLATLTPTVPEETQTRRATAQATPIRMDLVTPTPTARATSPQLLGVTVDQTRLAMIVTVHLATRVPMDRAETQRAMAHRETLTLMDQVRYLPLIASG